MIPEVGQFALVMALIMALVQTVFPLVGAHRGMVSWMRLSRPAAWSQFLFLAVAFGILMHSFIVHDFSVAYVATNSNSQLPTIYRISAVWGGHEGSLLLWAIMLSGWTVAVTLFSRNLPEEMVARVVGVIGFISIGFLLFMLLTSNPFDRLIPAPVDGRDLNPLLQDPGLIIHPPMLYMGYVGFSVAFGFAIAALLGGRLDSAWARWSRPWTTVAWVFMTGGIALGSWWAYYELGWGGWWFWDPVENASFMPWLVGTALIHSLAVSEKRSTFKNWTVLLAIFTFSLSLLGTFLVRSGVLTSVHAFATDPERGVFILGFLAVVIGGSLALYAWRAPTVKSAGSFQLVSRETALLTNNVILVVVCGTVLLGTIYPLILDAAGLGKISVGPPYFNAVFVPLMTPLFFLIGIGPSVHWKADKVADLARELRWVFVAALVVSLLLQLLITGSISLGVALGLFLGVWIVLTILHDVRHRLRNKSNLVQGLLSQPLSFYGMHCAHLGAAMAMVGVVLTSNFSVEKDVRMATGDSMALAGYTFTFDQLDTQPGPNYRSTMADVRVTDADGDLVVVLNPEKRIYNVQTMPMTEAGITSGLFKDLYVALGEPVDGNAWAVRLYVKPFVSWLWMGAIFMMLGGVLAISDRRYRLRVKRREAAEVDTNMAAEVTS
jgi:cytochrome c-type biogenesis protein CcmF